MANKIPSYETEVNAKMPFDKYCEKYGVEIVSIQDAGMYGNRNVFYIAGGKLLHCGGYQSSHGGWSCYFTDGAPCKWSDIRFSDYKSEVDWRKRCVADRERFIKELVLDIERLQDRQTPSNWQAICKRQFDTIKRAQHELKYHMRKLQHENDRVNSSLWA